MSCLAQFRILLRTIFSRFERVPSRVAPEEKVTRFICSRDHFHPTTGAPKVGAFLPPESGLSVYRTYSCGEEKIWWLGERYVARKRKDGKPILARADLVASDFFQQNLEIKKHPYPHPRHANVIGWPEDKPSKRMKATELANRAIGLIKPVGS